MARKKYEDEYDDWDEDELDSYDSYKYEKASSHRRGAEKKKKKKKSLLQRFLLLWMLMLALLGVLVYLNGWYVPILAKIGSKFVLDNVKQPEEGEISHDFTIPKNIPEGWAYDENVINVLLIGIEAIGSSNGAGRSDSMMLCSLDQSTGAIRVVSFLRDTYVDIEGHGMAKLNAAFAYGKTDLLVKTIENTYRIYIDAVAYVYFDDFEQVIDALGGVEITLTKQEAEYLNTTNYISDPANRTVTAGTNLLNGNQALGYCRVRKVPTPDGDTMVANDYGRTLRQRKVLSALFTRYKDQSLLDLFRVSKTVLSHVTTTLTQEQVEAMITAYCEHRGAGMTTQQIPAAGEFSAQTIHGADVLVPDLEKSIETLHRFLYGKTF